MTDKLACTVCFKEVAEGTKYLVVSKLPTGKGIAIQVGCSHETPTNLREAIAVLGGGNCAVQWFDRTFLAGLKCDHENESGGVENGG